MTIIDKIIEGIKNPKRIKYFLFSRFNESIILLKNIDILNFTCYILTGIFGIRFYKYLAEISVSINNTNYKKIPVRDFEMMIDLTDMGISRELNLYGTRESEATFELESLLEQLNMIVDEPVIIDGGANIGYYTIIEAKSVTDGKIIAVEPVDDNLNLLRKNIDINNLEKSVITRKALIGEETGTGMIEMSNCTNLHQLCTSQNIRITEESENLKKCPMWSLDDFINNIGIKPKDVNLFRMDFEGKEVHAIRGMRQILESPGPTILYIEMHNSILENKEIKEISNKLSSAGFEIHTVCHDIISNQPFKLELKCESLNQLHNIEGAYSLIVTKGIKSST